MTKSYGDITRRLLSLPVGGSCVVNVRRPDRYLKTARKHAPSAEWRVEHLDEGKVLTRVR